MDEKQILEKVSTYVLKRLKTEGSGHDWWHIERVRKLALYIARIEQANVFIVELAALLHDLIDDKLPKSIRLEINDVNKYLLSLGLNDSVRYSVLNIIQLISYRNKTPLETLTLEAKVVQDADRLDAIGAIGIARTFTYAGSQGNLIYEPCGHTKDAISHFYDKLLKLKDLMNTNTGKALADERHLFLEQYLDQFYHEWKGVT